MPDIKDVRLSELINPSPKQLECFKATDRCRFTLYGGAAAAKLLPKKYGEKVTQEQTGEVVVRVVSDL